MLKRTPKGRKLTLTFHTSKWPFDGSHIVKRPWPFNISVFVMIFERTLISVCPDGKL